MSEFADDRARNDTLGTEDPTQYRESKIAGSAEFADDQDHSAPDAGEQANLAIEGDQNQRTLDGETAATVPRWADE